MARRKSTGFYRRGSIWWVRTDPVTGRPSSTGCSDLDAALAWRRERERRAADPAYAAAETQTIGDWARRMIETKTHRSPDTRAALRQKMGHWLRVLGDACPLSDVTPSAIDAYVVQRREEGVKDVTIAKELSALRQTLYLAKRAGAWPGDLQTIRPPMLRATYVPRTRALTPEEVVALVRTCRPRLRTFVALAVAFGLRRSEVFRVTAADLKREELVVRGTKTAASARTVPVLSIFRPLVDAVDRSMLPVDYRRNLRRDILAACARIKIDACTPNDFRRTHATLLAERSVDPDIIRRFLGHTTRALVDRVYSRPRAALLAAQAEAQLGSEAKTDPLQIRYREALCSGVLPSESRVFSAGAPRLIRTDDLRIRRPASRGLVACGKRAFPRFLPSLATLESAQRDGTRRTVPLQAWHLQAALVAALGRRAA